MRSSLRLAVVVALLLGLLVPTAAVLLFDLQKTRLVALEDVRRDLSRSVEGWPCPWPSRCGRYPPIWPSR